MALFHVTIFSILCLNCSPFFRGEERSIASNVSLAIEQFSSLNRASSSSGKKPSISFFNQDLRSLFGDVESEAQKNNEEQNRMMRSAIEGKDRYLLQAVSNKDSEESKAETTTTTTTSLPSFTGKHLALLKVGG